MSLHDTPNEWRIDCRPAWARNHFPRVLPAGWFPEGAQPNLPGWWFLHETGLRVCAAGEIHSPDTRRWLHVSLSFQDRMPSYDDVNHVRKLFFGENIQVLQIWPPKAQYVNRHPFCLHLWACLDGDGLADVQR